MRRTNPSLGKSKVTHKEKSTLDTAASGIAGVVECLQQQLKALEQEIKADRKGVHDFRTQLKRLAMDREDTEARLARNAMWSKAFDDRIGPFHNKYDELTTNISSLYGSAKEEHVKGVALLIQEFKYHPLFKRTGDTFSAVPFKPL